jgi:segregation and condensation protein B
MDRKELQRICEAILFASGEPVETERLCFVTETDPDEVREALRELADLYAFERRGIRILRLEDSWQMCSQNDLAPWVTKALETRKPPKLSASQLETLTIIAYYQPTTKAFVEKLRGVDSSYSVAALLNKKLIEENGRLDAPGRPILYRTTPDFLRTFGLESLEDLPEMEKVQFSNSPDTVSEPDASAPVGSDAHIAPSADASAPVGSDAHIAPSQTTMEGIKS